MTGQMCTFLLLVRFEAQGDQTDPRSVAGGAWSPDCCGLEPNSEQEQGRDGNDIIEGTR